MKRGNYDAVRICDSNCREILITGSKFLRLGGTSFKGATVLFGIRLSDGVPDSHRSLWVQSTPPGLSRWDDERVATTFAPTQFSSSPPGLPRWNDEWAAKRMWGEKKRLRPL